MSKLRSRILLLAIVLITVLALGGYLRGWINPERLQALLLSAGIWAPLLYVVCYVLATAFLLPAFLCRDHQPLRLVGGTLERATGIEPVLPAWESKLSTLYFQHLQKPPRGMHAHAAHTLHALPDLRMAAGRLWDVFYHALRFATADLRLTSLCPKQADIRGP